MNPPDIVFPLGLETHINAELMMRHELEAEKLIFFQEKDETTDILSIYSAINLDSFFQFILYNIGHSS